MVKPIKNVRRINAAKKGILTPKPCWAEAFMILLLRRGCKCLDCPNREPPLSMDATLTVTVEDLKKFEQLKSNNRTSISFDPENQTITLKAPEIKLPEKNIVVPKRTVIGGN